MRIVMAILLTLVCVACFIGAEITYHYSYDVAIGQYLRLADDASVAQLKLDYLKQYKEAVHKNIRRNESRYIFKRERLTRDVQLKIIDSLVSRVSDMSSMDTKSFEYQQAMLQITGQEFGHTIAEVNTIIKSCWLRQSGFTVFGLWICPILWIMGILCCVNWETVRNEF